MKSAKGFTLIEMLVSVAMFTVVMVIALGALLAISTSNRKAESLKSVINNLNFSIDSMARAIRTGSDWNCATVTGGDCLSGGNYINFIPPSGVGRVYYKLESSSGSSCNQTGTVGCILRSTDNINWTPITSPEVIVTDCSGGGGCSGSGSPSYMFYTIGSSPWPDTTQPKLVITLSGFVRVTGGANTLLQCGTSGNQCSIFRLQTAVTQRIYDQ